MSGVATFYVDTNHAAWLLDKSPSTVRRWVRMGRLAVAYRVEQGAITEHRYERTAVGSLAAALGREPKCLTCWRRKSQHPIADCDGYVDGWVPRTAAALTTEPNHPGDVLGDAASEETR